MGDDLNTRRIAGGPLLPVVLVGLASEPQGLALIDQITGALFVTEGLHREVHEGRAFHAFFKTPDNTPIADNAAINIKITVPLGKEFHLVWESAVGGEHEREVLEDPLTTGGTAFTPHNMRRGSGNVSTAIVLTGVTVNAAGTLLDNQMVPGGTTGLRSGGIGQMRAGAEWILQGGKGYVLRATNRSGGTAQASISAVWYEENA